MAQKPAYEKLEQRVKELEHEAVKRKQAEETLGQIGRFLTKAITPEHRRKKYRSPYGNAAESNSC